MHVVRSDAELRAAILADMRSAMEKAEKQSLSDMQAATNAFYSGSPKRYKRTGALRSTPKTETGGGDAGFKAYLDTAHTYSTGKHPGMETVLNWAEASAYGLLGHLEWKATEKKIIDNAKDALKEYFSGS